MLPDADQLADVVTEAIKAATAPLVMRLAAVEAREPIHGKDGKDGKDAEPAINGIHGKDAPLPDLEQIAKRAAELVAPAKDGRDGTDGTNGIDGKDAPIVDVTDLRERLIMIEARVPETIAHEDVEAEFRKALADWTVPPVMQKRIIRDALGRVDRIIDEPVGARDVADA